MVREIVLVQLGQCGNQMALAFWKTMSKEHRLNTEGVFTGEKTNKEDEIRLAKVGVYFREVGTHHFVPRACLVDLESGTSDAIKSDDIGNMFAPDNFVFGSSGAGNNWAKGHYTDGAELIDEVLDVMRKEIEACDCPQGFQMTQSLGGGTGSGMGTLLLLKLRDAYPDQITCTFSVYPSPKVSDVVVEPYNATLSMHQLLENSDETFVIDNEALYNISHNILKLNQPKYSDLNQLVARVMSGITASLRFPGLLNGDLRKMGVNLVPFPRLHFFLVSQAPLAKPEHLARMKVSTQELTTQMWSARNFYANVYPEDGKYLTANCIFRGDVPSQEVDVEVSKAQDKFTDDFVVWIPNNIKTSIVSIPSEDTKLSGTFVANTTAMKGIFERISVQFSKMYRRKAFLHWYTGEGMDEMEFQESDKNLRDLVTEYQDKQDATIDEDDDDDDLDDDDDDADGGDDDNDDF